MNLRLENISKAQIQPSKRSNMLEILQKASFAEEAYSTVNPVMLQWFVRCHVTKSKSSFMYKKFFSSMCWILHFSSFCCHYCCFPLAYSMLEPLAFIRLNLGLF